MEEAIRKMTSLPAMRLGLKDRGVLGKGMAADLVLFDPAEIADRSTYTSPHQFPAGLPYVVVNGKIVVKEGQHTGLKPGRALFRN